MLPPIPLPAWSRLGAGALRRNASRRQACLHCGPIDMTDVLQVWYYAHY